MKTNKLSQKIICTVEGCLHLSENRDIGLCATHAREARKAAAPKAKPTRRRIPKQSDEGKERMAIYNAIRSLFMVDKICECCITDGIDTEATQVHHKKGRLGDLLYDIRHFMPVCAACHRYIEEHPNEAYWQGWSELRNANEPHEI